MERASHLEEMRSYAAQNAQDQLDDLDALLARSDDWGLELNALELPTPVLNSGASTQSAPAYNLAGDHQARADVAHRRLAAGRETQRRFRERKKATQRCIEADLAATKAELKAVQLREKQLQAKNSLLEQMSTLSKAAMSMYAQVPCCAIIRRKAATGRPVLTLHLRDQPQSLTIQSISDMSAVQFAQLWTAYMQKLANMLLDCNNLGRTVASEHLVSTLMEAASLYCCVTVYNVETLSQVLASRMDTGQPVEANELGDAFYTQFLAVANLSEAQMTDLLYLRQMCIMKRGQLANQRQAKCLQFPASCFSDMQMPLPPHNVVRLHSITALMRENGSEDFRVWSATMCACFRGVFTAIQHATAMVHAYPFLLNIDQLLDCLASQRGEATRLELLASAHTVNTASHWDRLYAYVNDLREVDYPVYVPYPKLSGGMPVTTRTQLSIKAIEHSDIF